MPERKPHTGGVAEHPGQVVRAQTRSSRNIRPFQSCQVARFHEKDVIDQHADGRKPSAGL